MRVTTFLLILLFIAGTVAAGEAKETTREAAPPAEFDEYYMVFLMRPEQPRDYGEERNAELQRQHLGHLSWLREEGYALVAGPFGADEGDAMRGIVLLRGDLEPERARELAEMDPRVKAGQLRVDVRPWFTAKGALAFPLKPAGESAGSGETKR
ncbi:MAG: hypothetical protein R3338_06835 [Thermoanaerobaculia bacterium]|nr:hypothetical protein [Thermoanaerobaculia bacterium]